MSNQFNLKWIVANSLAEMIGFMIGLGLSSLLWISVGPFSGPGMVLAVIVISAPIVGISIGYGQWAVLRHRLPQIARRTWIGATIVGAGIFWTFGMVAGASLALGTSMSESGPIEISERMVLFLLAAMMGLVLGPTLGVPQWWVLRRWVDKAVWWIPANALAWASGMVATFAGLNWMSVNGPTWTIAASALLVVAVAGAIVGAIHGLVPMDLLDNDDRVMRTNY